MTYQVKLANNGRIFEVDEDETILDAALRSGTRIRYGCRRGKCATCKHLVLDGDVDDSEVSPYALLDDEREEGLALLCQTYALSDCVVELIDAGGEDDDGTDLPRPRVVAATIETPVQLTPSLWLVALELEQPMPFLPGQYVEVEVPGQPGATRSYSIASAPSQPHRLELLVKRLPGGAFSGQLDRLAPRTRTAVEGPFGGMYLRPGDRPIVLIGAGSGLGPLLGILRHLSEVDPERAVRLFYGARSVAGIPLRDELGRLQARMPLLEVAVTLSQPDEQWDGPVGRVQALLGRSFGGEHDIDAYVCGPPAMCDDVTLFLEARGVASGRVHSDAFFAAEQEHAPI